jgi:hypothetical protein
MEKGKSEREIRKDAGGRRKAGRARRPGRLKIAFGAGERTQSK